MLRYLHIFYFILSDAVFHNNVKNTAKVKANDDSRVKHNAISGHLSDYFGFKPSENGSVLSVENVHCMTCHKAVSYTHLRAHETGRTT